MTLMLPVEVRILPTYAVVANLGLLNTYTGLTLPLIASATATFLFRQFFLTIPEELCEAAKMDGASPMTFFRKILLPLSKTNIAALVVIEFVYGWNQYLWPLLITTNPKMQTAVIGLFSGVAAVPLGVMMAYVLIEVINRRAFGWQIDMTVALDILAVSVAFAIGAASGILGDRWSLGFIAETERQVEKHLDEHLSEVCPEDRKTTAILEQMKEDEISHATKAVEKGGVELPAPIKQGMKVTAKLMTGSVYYL